MQHSNVLNIVGIILGVIFGAISGAFIVGSLLSFFGDSNGSLYGAIGGAVLVAIFGFIQMRRGKVEDDSSDTGEE